MSTITPILDTLLHQQLGRRASMERFTATRPNASLAAVTRAMAVRDAVSDSDPASQRMANMRSAGLARAGQAEGSSRATVASVTERPDTLAVRRATPAQGASPESAALHFSRAGQTIAALLGRFARAPAAATQAGAPLLSSQAAPSVPVLASMLGRQLGESGVFYESHLLKWIEGKRPFAQLAREPQARLPRSAAHGQAASDTRVSQLSGKPGASASMADAGDGTPESIPDALLPVIRQQLEALGSGIFRWQGLAWPDAPMQWEVSEHELPAGQDDAEDPDRLYSTRLSLDLPALGNLQIRMSLASGQLQMYAWSGSELGTRALQPQTGVLEQRLQRAGFDAVQVRLITGEPAA